MRQNEIYSIVSRLLSARTAGKKCEICGTRVRFLKGAFYLQKSILKWEMLLPFCPSCEGSMEGSLDYDSVFQDNEEIEVETAPRNEVPQ
jgi:hypothetical protein